MRLERVPATASPRGVLGSVLDTLMLQQ